MWPPSTASPAPPGPRAWTNGKSAAPSGPRSRAPPAPLDGPLSIPRVLWPLAAAGQPYLQAEAEAGALPARPASGPTLGGGRNTPRKGPRGCGVIVRVVVVLLAVSAGVGCDLGRSDRVSAVWPGWRRGGSWLRRLLRRMLRWSGLGPRAAPYTVRIAAVTAAAPVLAGAAAAAATAKLAGWELRQLTSSPLSADARRLRAGYRELAAANGAGVHASAAAGPRQAPPQSPARSGKAGAQPTALITSLSTPAYCGLTQIIPLTHRLGTFAHPAHAVSGPGTCGSALHFGASGLTLMPASASGRRTAAAEVMAVMPGPDLRAGRQVVIAAGPLGCGGMPIRVKTSPA